MKVEEIALLVALQRYVVEPPLAKIQRELAITLARTSGARVDVITVQAPVHQLPSAEPLDKKLEAFVAPIAAEGVAMKTYLLEGKPRDVLPSFLETHGPDLVIAGTHSKQRPTDIAMGNTATALLRAFGAARVLLVRPTTEEIEEAQKLMIPGAPWAFIYV